MTPSRPGIAFTGIMFTAALLGGCALQDSRTAQDARTRLMGMSEVDLESCLGVPDQHSSFGNIDVLTYYASSTSSTSYSVPLIGGIGLTNGAYCHATFQVKDGQVTQVLYSGEKNASLAPDAYCAPIMRTCLEHLDDQQKAARQAATAHAAAIQAAATQAAAPRPAASTAASAAPSPPPAP